MAMNKECCKYCIDVIRAVMQKEAVPEFPETFSLAELYAFSKMHGVEAMVFHGLEQLGMDENDPLWQNWRNRADMLLTQSMVQLAERDMLFAALPAGGIQILPVKGCWLKEQYPDIDYRQMSDLDILIHEEDALRAKNAMAELGYTAQEEETAENHDCYGKPPYLEVELHRSLLEKNDDRYGYYLDVWEKAEPVADCAGMFRLKAEDEYIYYLLHLYKHVVASGTGLRTILDCLVYRNVYPDMDRAYLRKEWKKLELTEFAQQIETLSDCWFKTGTPVPEQLERLASTIMAAGSYGNFEIFRDQKLEGLQQKYKNPFIRALMYWVSLICRPREEMERQYPIVKKLPVLLPVFWIVRAVGKFASRPKAVLHHVKSVFGRVKKDD